MRITEEQAKFIEENFKPPVFIIDAIEGITDPLNFQYAYRIEIGEVRFHNSPYSFEIRRRGEHIIVENPHGLR